MIKLHIINEDDKENSQIYNSLYGILPCIMHIFFAQIFEEKIRVHIIHGHNEI